MATFKRGMYQGTVSPPGLTTSAPIFSVFRPIFMNILMFNEVRFRFVVRCEERYRIYGVLRLRRPLRKRFQFSNCVNAFQRACLVDVDFCLFRRSNDLRILFGLFACVGAIRACVRSNDFTRYSIVVRSVGTKRIVFFTGRVIVRVVNKYCFRASYAGFGICMIIFSGQGSAICR